MEIMFNSRHHPGTSSTSNRGAIVAYILKQNLNIIKHQKDIIKQIINILKQNLNIRKTGEYNATKL